MKKSVKVIAALMSIVMIAACMPFGAFAASANLGDAAEANTSTQVGMVATNPVGDLIADAFNEDPANDDAQTGYNVHQVVLLRADKAKAELKAPDDSTLVVAIFDEDTGEMVTSGSVAVDSETETATVELEDAAIPEYYIIRAYLVDSENRPLCEACENKDHTKIFTEFFSKTIYDFDPERVILTDDGNYNFAAVSEKAVLLTSNASTNTLAQDGYVHDGVYIFENADDTLKSVHAGDTIYAVTSAAADGFVLVKVKTVTVSGANMTVTADENADPGDLFSFVRIDATSTGGVENHKDTETDSIDEEKTIWDDTVKFKVTNNDKARDDVIYADAKVNFSIDVSIKSCVVLKTLKYYYDVNWGEDGYFFEFNTDFKVDVTGKVEVAAAFSVTFDPLGKVKEIPIAAGIGIELQFPVTISFSGKVDAQVKLSAEQVKGAKTEKIPSKNIRNSSKTDNEPDIKLEFNVEISAEIKLEISPQIKFKIVKIIYVAFEGRLAIKADISLFEDKLSLNKNGIKPGASLPFLPWSELDAPEGYTHDCDVCLRANCSMEASVSVKIGIKLFDEKKEGSKPDADKNSSDDKNLSGFNFKVENTWTFYKTQSNLGAFRVSFCKGKFEFEYMRVGQKSCPHIKYCVTFLVLDLNNEPVKDMQIKIDPVFDKDTPDQVIPEGQIIKTNEKGCAVVFLPSFNYSYIFQSDDYEDISPAANRAFVVKDRAKDITVTTDNLLTVNVTVVGTDGNAIGEATVTCGNKTAVTDADGKAQIKALIGEQTFNVKTADGKTGSATAQIEKNGDNVTVEVDVGRLVTVNVVDTYGNRLPNATVNGEKTDENGQVVLLLSGGKQMINAFFGGFSGFTQVTVEDQPIETTVTIDRGHKVTCF